RWPSPRGPTRRAPRPAAGRATEGHATERGGARCAAAGAAGITIRSARALLRLPRDFVRGAGTARPAGNPGSHHMSSGACRTGSYRMNKSELIDHVAEGADLSRADAGRAVDAFVATITKALKGGDSVTLVGFGTFEARKRGARTGRNPRTGAEIAIAASGNPAFKGGKALKDAVNGGPGRAPEKARHRPGFFHVLPSPRGWGEGAPKGRMRGVFPPARPKAPLTPALSPPAGRGGSDRRAARDHRYHFGAGCLAQRAGGCPPRRGAGARTPSPP